MSKAYLLLGSNMGDRSSILSQARDMIGKHCGSIISCSPLYESEPWGFKADVWFVNQVVELSTDMEPFMLLVLLLDIERKLGRRRNGVGKGYASRTIDIDILYYDNLVTDTQDLVLPHPRLHLRRFALLPMCDLAPDMPHPLLGLTQREMLEKCADRTIVKPYVDKDH